jgi:hypothetical protein
LLCRDEEFLACDVVDLSQLSEVEYDSSDKVGCRRFNALAGESIERTTATCRVLDGIECLGVREFQKTGYPCIKFSGYRYTSALVLSLFLGVLGADMFYLGYTFVGFMKLFTLGGFGMWFLLDLILLLAGKTGPVDTSSWEPYY